jgi:hypothetical protein
MAPARFELRDVVHLVRPWGRPAGNLEELRQAIATAPVEVLFHHAVQYQLRHPAAEELPRDDFSAWIGGVAQDAEVAERLSFAVQARGTAPDPLRAALLEVLDSIPARRRQEGDAPEESAFRFLSATSLSYPAGLSVRDGHELVEALLEADAGVWFFHLIEEPWRGAGRAPLLEWLDGLGQQRLAGWLREAAGSGRPIDAARARVLRRWRRSRIGRSVAEVATAPDAARREAGREAVARLVRHRPRSERVP